MDKVTLPAADTQSFSFTAGGTGYVDFSLTDAAAPNSQAVAPGAYSVSETVPAGWDQTSATCDNGETIASIDVGPGETITCTFTNTKRGMVEVEKFTNDVHDPLRDINFTLYLSLVNPLTNADDQQLANLTTLGDADGVLQFAPKLVPGTLYTICENPVPAAFTSEWTINGVIVTPYNPGAIVLPAPGVDLGVRCFNFTVTPGQTLRIVVNNDHPGGDPRTIGYWKNWNRCTGGGQAINADRNGGAASGFYLVEDLLPQTIGDLIVNNCLDAVDILDKSSLDGKKRADDAAYMLAAQFLAARFNLTAGAETCGAVEQAVLDAQALLAGNPINFNGTGGYLDSKVKGALLTLRNQAIGLARTLDLYNNGILCP